MLIILCMIGVGFIIADENANQLILLGLLGSLIVLILLFYHLYKLEIIVDESHLHLRLGKGNLGKRFLLSEIEIDSFSEKKITWYYGIGWKYDHKGNIFFNANPGIALCFRLKGNAKKIMIVTNNREKLKNEILQGSSYSRKNQ